MSACEMPERSASCFCVTPASRRSESSWPARSKRRISASRWARSSSLALTRFSDVVLEADADASSMAYLMYRSTQHGTGERVGLVRDCVYYAIADDLST